MRLFYRIWTGLALWLPVCLQAQGDGDIPLYKSPHVSVERRIDDLLSRMTLEEKIAQLDQDMVGRLNHNANNMGKVRSRIPADIGSLIYCEISPELRNAIQQKAVKESRLGIPILFGHDAIHGFRTIFPIPLGQAAAWNPNLTRQACEVTAHEAYQAGINWTFSPMLDVARDGRWGRIAEGYGEDVYTNSVFAAATVKGYQGESLSSPGNIAACLKHYVGYGASEAGRDYMPTDISAQTLWDTYLPPFKTGIDAGALTVMSAFNTLNGIPTSANSYTLTSILKDKWGFRGFVVSDWQAVEQLGNQGVAENLKDAARLSFNAGVDMDMKDGAYRRFLRECVEDGSVSEAQIDEAVRRVLRVKFTLGLFEHPYTETQFSQSLPQSSKAVAEQLAEESMVLLKNEKGILPLHGVKRIAVIGPMAKDQRHISGSWYGMGSEADVVSLYQGIVDEWKGKAQVAYAQGCDFGNDRKGLDEAARVAGEADVVILCLGEKREWSGENASRASLSLPSIQEELLKAVSKSGKPVVVLLSNGRPLDLKRIAPMANAMLEMWQPGAMGGKAVGGILSGRYNPSGKLPVTFPYSEGQIPIYYNRRRSGRATGLYQDIPSAPFYAFGYGLSYTTFEYGALRAPRTRIGMQDTLRIEVDVTNTGRRKGKETVHWFIADPVCSVARPIKELKHFEKQMLEAGEKRTFAFDVVPERDLAYVDGQGRPVLEPGEYHIMVGNQQISIYLETGKAISILPGEKWWGCFVGISEQMPFRPTTQLFDLSKDNFSNQSTPFMLSSKGRYVWSDYPYTFQMKKDSLFVSSSTDGEIEIVQAGHTLRDAFMDAAHKHFPATGTLPDTLFFSRPQYNTWIELMYNQNQADILAYAHNALKHGFPPGIFMVDDNWQWHYGNFDFKAGRFPDPKAMCDELHRMGFKIMLWICPFVTADSPEYRELEKRGLLLKKKDGSTAMIQWWNGYSACFDLTNPQTVEYLKQTLRHTQDKYGVDGFKFDAGDVNLMQGDYAYHDPKGDANLFSQKWAELAARFPYNELRATWKTGGMPLVQRLCDKTYSWQSNSLLIPGMTTAGLLGYPYACPDMIGGGEYRSFLQAEGQKIDQELIVRSCQIHALMPMMQFSVAPWRILDEKHLRICAKMAQLHQQMGSYILQYARKASHTNEPIMRSMEYQYPNQGFEECKDQFMLGDSILVAPMIDKGYERTVRLPKGKWADERGKHFTGPTTIRIQVPIERLPYYRLDK